jgi:hypothetical protein
MSSVGNLPYTRAREFSDGYYKPILMDDAS